MLSKKSLALAAQLLATYTHSELSNMFLLFDIEESVPAGSNKLSRAMGVIKQSEGDPSTARAFEGLMRHVVELRELPKRASRGELDSSESALLRSFEHDGFIVSASLPPARSATAGSREPAARSEGPIEQLLTYDFFISHASEDKESFARPLATELVARGCAVWYDEFSLDIGDSLRESIDFGLGASRFGVVVLSRSFFGKEWPNKELGGLAGLERGGRKVILPIWHDVTEDEVRRFSPMLADLVAIKSQRGVSSVADALQRQLGARSVPHAAPVVALSPGPLFRSHLRAPNSRAWALVLAAPVPEGDAPLDDAFHDDVQAAFANLQANARCLRQTDEYTMWADDESNATWIGEVFRGPLVMTMRAMSPVTGEAQVSIDLSSLIRWWLRAISATREIIGLPAGAPVALGFSLNPYPAGSGALTGLDFGDLPPAQRIAAPHAIAPWDFRTVCLSADRMPEEITAAAASLLKVYSYRRLDATLAAIRGEAVGPATTAPLDDRGVEGASQRPAPGDQRAFKPIKLVRIVVDEVTRPRNDGTQGSALYRVPIQLSREPSPEWCRWFIEAWDHPPQFTTMHRPRIASVIGSRVILDGTSLEEIRDYHRETLNLAVRLANDREASAIGADAAAQQQELERRRRHDEDVKRLADDITFN